MADALTDRIALLLGQQAIIVAQQALELEHLRALVRDREAAPRDGGQLLAMPSTQTKVS